MNFVLLAFQAMPLADTHAILAVTPLLVTALFGPAPRRAGGLAAHAGGRRRLMGVLIILRLTWACSSPARSRR